MFRLLVALTARYHIDGEGQEQNISRKPIGTLCGLWRMIRDIIDPAKRGGLPSSEDAPRGEPSE